MTGAVSPGGTPGVETVGGFDRQARLWVAVMFGLGGAAVGAVLPFLTRVAADMPWVPFEGPIRLLGSFDQQWLVVGRPSLGLVAGLAFAAWVVVNAPVLHLSHDSIQVKRHGAIERVIDRSKVDAVYQRRSRVVIETKEGRRLFDDDIEGDSAGVRAAFVRLGYPWEGGPAAQK